jgi:UDP-N-acetylglucosamine 2-epimerase
MRLKILGIHDGHNASATLSEDGWNVLAGPNKDKIIEAVKVFEPECKQRDLFEDRKASERICEILENCSESFKLMKQNPEYQERFK